MKQSNMFLTRCLAVLLALAMCLSNISTGLALTVFAADNSDEISVNAAESVAQNNEQMNAGGINAESAAKHSTTLYSLIAKMYGNGAAAAILNSGALAGNVVINYDLPSAELMTLVERVLTAENQPSGFGNAEWVATTYGPTYETADAYTFVGTTAEWETKSVFVKYVLDLSDYNAVAANMQTTLQTLKTQYDEQKSAMEDLLAQKEDMLELSRVKLQVFHSVIKGYDFTSEDNNPNDAKNLELRDYFLNLIDTLLNDCSDSTNLIMVSMLENYETTGMAYFYNNDDAIVSEVAKLSATLNGLVGDEEKEAALADLMGLFGYDEMVAKIAKLGSTMESIGSRLYSNDEVLSGNILALKAFTNAMEAAVAENILVEAGELYIAAAPIKVQDDSVVSVIITVNNGSGDPIYIPGDFDLDAVVTEELVETIIEAAKVEADKIINGIVETLANEKNIVIAPEDFDYFFDVAFDAEALKAQVGANIGTMTMPNLDAAPAQFLVSFLNPMARMAEIQTITVVDPIIELPQYSDDYAYRYEYYLNGEQLVGGIKEFTQDEMKTLFVDRQLTIEKVVIDHRAEMLNMLETALVAQMGAENVDMNGNVLTITLTGKNGFSNMTQGILDSGVTYVTLNNEDFFYGENGDQKLAMQALLNAILADSEFGSERIIALAKENGGVLTTIAAELGEYDLETGKEIVVVDDLTLVLELGYAPEKLVTLGNGLEKVKNNFSFTTEQITGADGNEHYALALELTAPEKLYEAYLAVLLVSGEIDQSNINAINNEIAVEFFYDYVDAVMGSEDLSIVTFQNTLDILTNAADKLPKIEVEQKDVLHLENYFNLVNNIYKNLTYYPMGEAAGQLLATSTDKGLLEIMDIFDFQFTSEVASLVVELQPGANSYFWTTANLSNTSVDFEALVFDLDAGVNGMLDVYNAYKSGELKEEAVELLKGNGVANAVDFTTNLSKRASELTGQAIIVLMGDTNGDLIVNEATILDLNGHTINGDVIANGHLLIVDSTMSNNQAGGVNGNVSGHVLIISGNYTDDVTAFLADGYAQENGMVHNELYRVEKVGNEITYVLNSDVMHEQAVNGLLPNMGVVAAEIAVDVALNQYPLTYLAVNGTEVMNLNVEDIIGAMIALVNSDLLKSGAEEILDRLNKDQLITIAENLADELLDFVAIAKSISVSDFLNETPDAVIETIEIMHNAADIAKELAAELKEFAAELKSIKNADGLRDAILKVREAFDGNEILSLVKELKAELNKFVELVKSLNIPTNYDEMKVAARKVIDIINGSGIFGLAIEIGAELNDFAPYAEAVVEAAKANKEQIVDAAQIALDLLKNNDVINVSGIAALAKEIAADLTNFGAIADAIDNDEKIGDYEISVAPWDLTFDHIYGSGKDYLTVGFEANTDELKTVVVGLKFEGENVKQFVALLRELKAILDTERSYLDVDVFKPAVENNVLSLGGTVEGRLSFDLTVKHNADGAQNCYPTVIAVALAYGNPDNRAELVAALKSGEKAELKAAIDNCTVEDVISTMKLMSRTVTFAEMAAAVGVKVSADEVALESIWHFVTVAFGKLLEFGDEIGRDSKLGSLDQDGDGVYVLKSTYSADADVYAKGYGLYVNAEKLYECFEVKVMDLTEDEIPEVNPENPDETDCLWGDVNHDGDVNSIDATLVLQWTVELIEKTGDLSALFEGEEIVFCFAKADVNGDGEINSIDATLILQYAVEIITVFPAEIAG